MYEYWFEIAISGGRNRLLRFAKLFSLIPPPPRPPKTLYRS
jgi:hypothetical protein